MPVAVAKSISVVIPTLDNWRTIRRALNSAVNQSIKPKEIILVDDGSTEEYISYLRSLILKTSTEHVNLVLVLNCDNKGPSCSRNRGWELSSGNYVAFLDADDAWYPCKLQTQLDIMNRTGCDVLGVAAVQCIDESVSVYAHSPLVYDSLVQDCSLHGFLFRNKYTTTSSVMLLRSLPVRFDSARRYSEDYLLWLELLSEGYDLKYLNVPLTCYFKSLYGESGLSASLINMGVSELSNISYMYAKRKIGLFVYVASYLFSCMKFFRRIIINVFR